MAHRSDRRGVEPISRLAVMSPDKRLAPRVRLPILARRPKTLHQRAEDTPAVTICLQLITSGIPSEGPP